MRITPYVLGSLNLRSLEITSRLQLINYIVTLFDRYSTLTQILCAALKYY